MKFSLITNYCYQGSQINFYGDEKGNLWFSSREISVPCGFYSQFALNFEIRMGSQKELKPFSCEILLKNKKKKSLMIQEKGLYSLIGKYNHSDFLGFLDFIRDRKENSISIRNHIKKNQMSSLDHTNIINQKRGYVNDKI